MASKKKKQTVEESEVATNKSDNEPGPSDESDLDITDESENEFMDQKMQVEFEARMPDDSDFHGIKTLLQQLFLKSNIDLSELTNIIIAQNYVGSVFKQIDPDDDEDSIDDDDDDPVFGIVTAVNLTDKLNKECIRQIITMMTTQCEVSAPELAGNIMEILHNPNEPVGFLINERFINIPPQITVPALQSLKKDLQKAISKNMAFTFTYLLMLCKTYRYKVKGKAPYVTPELFYSNPEEEFIAQMSDISTTWSVSSERDGVSDGRWDSDDMEATRTLLLFQANKLDNIIEKLQTELAKLVT